MNIQQIFNSKILVCLQKNALESNHHHHGLIREAVNLKGSSKIP